jgi:hypothetical protein
VAGLYRLQLYRYFRVVFQVYRVVDLAECALPQLSAQFEDFADC